MAPSQPTNQSSLLSAPGRQVRLWGRSRQVTDAEVRRMVKKLNDRPRKRLGYRTPAQVFMGEYSGALDTSGAVFFMKFSGLLNRHRFNSTDIALRRTHYTGIEPNARCALLRSQGRSATSHLGDQYCQLAMH